MSQKKVSHFYFQYYFAICWDNCTIFDFRTAAGQNCAEDPSDEGTLLVSSGQLSFLPSAELEMSSSLRATG